jgi:hypothetical protein
MAVVSLRAYARHRGVSLKAVQKAIESGRIQTTEEGKIDVEQADADWEKNTAPRAGKTAKFQKPPAGRKTSTAAAAASNARLDPASAGGLDYARARAVHENYRARLAKLDYEAKLGKLVSRDEVEIAAFNRFRTLRDGMLNIPDRLAAVLAAETDPIKVHELLTTEIRKALLDFSDGKDG